MNKLISWVQKHPLLILAAVWWWAEQEQDEERRRLHEQLEDGLKRIQKQQDRDREGCL